MPIDNPINYSDIEDLGDYSDLAKTLLRLLRDSANILSPLLNPTSINDAINLFKLFQNINLGNSSNFSGRLFNLLREFEENASNTDLNNISSKLPENITPSPAETGEKALEVPGTRQRVLDTRHSQSRLMTEQIDH